jgi:hypothetical protein
MRISRTWLRPILTAVLFPVVLLGSMWGVDEYAQWRAERLVNVSRQQALDLAWSQCFKKMSPGRQHIGWAHPWLGPDGWTVTAHQSRFDPLLQRYPLAFARIATSGPLLLDCRRIGPGF